MWITLESEDLKQTDIPALFFGRFQPFHNGHKALLEQIAERVSTQIIIGVVNPDLVNPYPGDDEDGWVRFRKDINPFTFWERLEIIKLSIANTGLEKAVKAILPMPRPSVNIDRANQLIPPKPRKFVVCPKWNDEIEEWKLEKYRDLGEETVSINHDDIPKPHRFIEGSLIRSLVMTSNKAWENLVSENALPYLQLIGFEARIRGVGDVEKAHNYLSKARNGEAAVLFSKDGENADETENPEMLAVSLLLTQYKTSKTDDREVICQMDREPAMLIISMIDNLYEAGEVGTRANLIEGNGRIVQLEMKKNVMHKLRNEYDR